MDTKVVVTEKTHCSAEANVVVPAGSKTITVELPVAVPVGMEAKLRVQVNGTIEATA